MLKRACHDESDDDDDDDDDKPLPALKHRKQQDESDDDDTPIQPKKILFYYSRKQSLKRRLHFSAACESFVFVLKPLGKTLHVKLNGLFDRRFLAIIRLCINKVRSVMQ
jgi:hypothetical protein